MTAPTGPTPVSPLQAAADIAERLAGEDDSIGRALRHAFISATERDSAGDAANVADALMSIGRGLFAVADAIRGERQP